MEFSTPLVSGTLVCRYKRFLADVRLDTGELVTAHCANTGRMLTCSGSGWRVALSESDNPCRRLRYTWEMVHNGRCWIGVNTHMANRLAVEGIRSGTIAELTGYDILRTERPYGTGSRVDILLEREGAQCYVEVKNVTLVTDDGCYAFPDAVTERGKKHLAELAGCVAAGHRAVMLYVIQRADGVRFRPAYEVDPSYCSALAMACSQGVEVLSYRAEVSPSGICVRERVQCTVASKG